jgi:hypothetical protein
LLWRANSYAPNTSKWYNTLTMNPFLEAAFIKALYDVTNELTRREAKDYKWPTITAEEAEAMTLPPFPETLKQLEYFCQTLDAGKNKIKLDVRRRRTSNVEYVQVGFRYGEFGFGHHDFLTKFDKPNKAGEYEVPRAFFTECNEELAEQLTRMFEYVKEKAAVIQELRVDWKRDAATIVARLTAALAEKGISQDRLATLKYYVREPLSSYEGDYRVIQVMFEKKELMRHFIMHRLPSGKVTLDPSYYIGGYQPAEDALDAKIAREVEFIS